jgi:biotin carboxyl carrier protein
MEFKVGDLAQQLEGEIISTFGNESILIKISGKEHMLKLLKSGTNESEFILDHSCHHARILQSSSSEIKISIDDQPLTIKRHSKVTEVLEKSLSLTSGGGENILTSQIPGRVISILAKPGTSVKKGDALVILESMKMQVAVKSHKDGNVKEIRAKEGATVARHDVVAVIE